MARRIAVADGGDTSPAVAVGLPVEDPILIFGLAMIVFLTAPLLFQRYRLPGIVGVLLVGAAVGPNGFAVLERDATIVLLGEVGLVYLMFVAGLEINLNRFLEYRNRSLVFGLLSFVVPQAVGTVVGTAVLGLSLPAALLFAAIFASHTLLAYPVVNSLGIRDDESVTVTVGGTIVTDTLALLVLAVVIAADGGDIGGRFWLELFGGLALFFAGVWLVVPRIGRWFFRAVDEESYFDFLFVMAVLFVCAYLAEVARVEPIIGAFLAGLVLNRLVPRSGPLMNRIEFVGNALFIPFFLLSVGMLVDVRVLTAGLEVLAIATAFVVLVVITKYVAAWLTAELYDYSHDQAVTMFGLSLGQAAAALAIVLIGFEAELFGEAMLNAVIVLILVASVLSPSVVDRAGRALARTRDRQAYDPSDVPQRVLIPFSRHSEYRERLLDLGLLVREERSLEPLYTLTVARPAADTEAELAAIEADLAETEAYTAGADVPVRSQTRIEQNVASGIVRAVLENRITTLIIGWDGAASRRQRVFGDVIDRVLTRTRQLVLVARVREPLNTTERIVLVLPPAIAHNEGFAEAVHTIEGVAEQVGASIRIVVVDGDPEAYERRFADVGLEVPATFEGAPSYDAVVEELDGSVARTDLVVAMSARRDAVGWQPALQTFPKRISGLTDGNFLVVYPASGGRSDDRQFLRFR
ncbi:cation:proton antiporter [Natrononativus amylolyticus]|uniref:cation:proton antiporter n=1 Tax=Natrononativus amylolyticus TaxID=2963434 RepID=UPI0020CD57F2|nr:cation:proton antiporter [Natrononativus amylolyticus]